MIMGMPSPKPTPNPIIIVLDSSPSFESFVFSLAPPESTLLAVVVGEVSTGGDEVKDVVGSMSVVIGSVEEASVDVASPEVVGALGSVLPVAD